MTLAMIYVFAMSTYIVFLSSRTHVHHHHKYLASAAVQHLSGAGATANFYDKQHGAFKSTFPNKRNTLGLLFVLLVVAAFVLIRDRLAAFSIFRVDAYRFLPGNTGRQHCRDLCILRI